MSRKDYERIASVIAAERALLTNSSRDTDLAFIVLRNLTLSIADTFAQENARFDRQRFYAASGM